MSVEVIITRARGLIGTPFLLHGRNPTDGLDCVGFVAWVFGQSGAAPTGYTLRNGEGERWAALLNQFARPNPSPVPDPGDILLMQPGPAHFHLGLWTGHSLIHADARLRQVVERPGVIIWPLLGAWSAQVKKDN